MRVKTMGVTLFPFMGKMLGWLGRRVSSRFEYCSRNEVMLLHYQFRCRALPSTVLGSGDPVLASTSFHLVSPLLDSFHDLSRLHALGPLSQHRPRARQTPQIQRQAILQTSFITLTDTLTFLQSLHRAPILVSMIVPIGPLLPNPWDQILRKHIFVPQECRRIAARLPYPVLLKLPQFLNDPRT